MATFTIHRLADDATGLGTKVGAGSSTEGTAEAATWTGMAR